MTPQIALDLSLDGIAVLSRVGDGTWLREGIVQLDTEHMGERLTALRERCADRVGSDFTTILILPESQLLFTSLERDDRDPKVTIRTLMRGRTPYEVEELAFDYVQKGDRLQVAVVALETLREAESFAAGFGFRPIAILGQTGDATFPGLPNFGPTEMAADLLGFETLDLDVDDGFDVVSAPAASGQVSPDEAPEADTPSDMPPPAPDTTDTGTPIDDDRDAGTSSPAAPEDPSDPARPVSRPLESDASFLDTLAALDPPTPPRAVSPSEATAANTPAPKGVSTSPEDTRENLPTFSSRRRAEPAEPSRRATPHLSGGTADGRHGVGRTVPPIPVASASGAEPEPPRAATDPDERPPAPSLSARRDTAIAAMMTPADPDIEADEAAASDHERATAAPRKAGGAKLGLYLTLSLLALMGLIALWSVLSGDGDAPDPTEASVIDVAPPAVLVPNADPSTEPDPSVPATADTADLLPPPTVPDGTAVTAAAPDDAIVSAPIPVPATPAGINPEAPASGAPSATVAGETAPGTLAQSPVRPEAPTLGDADRQVAVATDPGLGAAGTSSLPPALVPDVTPVPGGPAAPAVSVEANAPTVETADDPIAEAAPLVVASAEGTVAPGGYTVIAGRPDVLPLRRAQDVEPAPDTVPTVTEGEAPVAEAAVEDTPSTDATEVDAAETEGGQTPDETASPTTADGITQEEPTAIRPQPRPASLTDATAEQPDAEAESAARVAAAAASAASTAASAERSAAVEAAASAAVASLASEATTETEAVTVQSAQALAASSRPRTRPQDVERVAAQIVTRRREQAAAPAVASTQNTAPASAPATQTIRSAGGSVARAATQQNAIRLRDINVIGIYGRPNARRALVRLANGRYVKVQVGDRLNRGRVTAIGDTQVVYQQGGRNVALNLPSG